MKQTNAGGGEAIKPLRPWSKQSVHWRRKYCRNSWKIWPTCWPKLRVTPAQAFSAPTS